MTNYTNYDFYKDIYKGIMSEDDFKRMVTRASYEIRRSIFNKDTTNYKDEIQLATCSVADILLKIENLENKKDTIISEKRIKSESVADISRTFEQASISDIEVQIVNQKEKLQEEIRMYLLNTGLLYRSIEVY